MFHTKNHGRGNVMETATRLPVKSHPDAVQRSPNQFPKPHLDSTNDLRRLHVYHLSGANSTQGFHSQWGIPDSWVVFWYGKSHRSWMISRGTAILGNLQFGDDCAILIPPIKEGLGFRVYHMVFEVRTHSLWFGFSLKHRASVSDMF